MISKVIVSFHLIIIIMLNKLIQTIRRDNLKQDFPTSNYIQSGTYQDSKNMLTNFAVLKAMQSSSHPFVDMSERLYPQPPPPRQPPPHAPSMIPSHQQPQIPISVPVPITPIPLSKNVSNRSSTTRLWSLYPESDTQEILERMQRNEYDKVLKQISRTYHKLREECITYLKDMDSHRQSSNLPRSNILAALSLVQDIHLELWYYNPEILPLYVHKSYHTPSSVRAKVSVLVKENADGIRYEECLVDDIPSDLVVEHQHEKPKVKTCKEWKERYTVLNMYTVDQVKERFTMVMFEKLI